MTTLAGRDEGVNTPGEHLIAEMNDDALAEMSDGFFTEAVRLSRLARGAHEELWRRMMKREATHLETEHWSGRMKPGLKEHYIDDPIRLRKRLGPSITAGDRRAAFVQPPAPPMRVDHRVLNQLYLLGGEVARIIDEERRTVTGEPQLKLTRKAEVE